jgi:hypothetical protein
VSTNMSPRRIIRAQRLTAELGHADTLDALLHAERMRSALRVIHTWAGVPGALDARQVRDLTRRALEKGSK